MDELINFLKNALEAYRKKKEVRKPDYDEFPIRKTGRNYPTNSYDMYEFDAPGYDSYKLYVSPDGRMIETSEKNNVERRIDHYPLAQSDTSYVINPYDDNSFFIKKDSPVYINAKRQYEGTLPLLKRQGGKIVTVYK